MTIAFSSICSNCGYEYGRHSASCKNLCPTMKLSGWGFNEYSRFKIKVVTEDDACIEEIKKDALRYRWLCDNMDVMLITGFFGNGCINKTIEDVAIELDNKLVAPTNMVTLK